MGILPGRDAATQRAGEERCGQGEKQHREAHADVGLGGHRKWRQKSENHAQHQPREAGSQEAADQGERQAFRQEVGDHLATRCAESRTNGYFFLTDVAAREQQVGHVHTSNQQHKTNRAQEQPQILDGVAAGEIVLEGLDAGAPTFVGDGISLGDVLRGGVHIGVVAA